MCMCAYHTNGIQQLVKLTQAYPNDRVIKYQCTHAPYDMYFHHTVTTLQLATCSRM